MTSIKIIRKKMNFNYGIILFWLLIIDSLTANFTSDISPLVYRSAFVGIIFIALLILNKSKSSLIWVGIGLLCLLIGSYFYKESYPIANAIYSVAVFMIVIISSAEFYKQFPEKFKNIIKLFIYINFPILVLQFLGLSQSLHAWNTLFSSEIMLSPVFLIDSDVFTALFSQLRSPGLFYSSAILGAFLTLVISFRWSQNFKKCTLYDYILIATILFSMNKTVFVFMCVLVLLCLVYSSSQERKALYHIASIIIIGIIFMIILFPGAVSNRFTLDAFKSSGGIRILDFLISLNIKQFVDPDDLLEVYSTKYQDESEIGNLSGIWQYFIFIPLVILILIFNKNKADSVFMKKNIKFFIIISIACIFNMFSHPIMLNKTLAFLLGPYFLVIKNFFLMKRSVSSSSPLPGASVHPTT